MARCVWSGSNKDKWKIEDAVFWMTGEHGEMLACADHIYSTLLHHRIFFFFKPQTCNVQLVADPD